MCASPRGGSCCIGGYVQSVTNALSQTTAFTPDAAGRILQQLDPGSALTAFTWDGNGNLTSVTPPGQPAHGQTFTLVDLLATYAPPVVPGVPAPSTLFTYNVDRQLTQTTRPDALLVGRTYDAAGKLDLLTTPAGNVDYDYFGLTPCPTCAPGRLQKITDPSGVVLEHAYDGMLLKSLTWSGPVVGSVSFGHDSSFRVTSETVTVGATTSPVAFGYERRHLDLRLAEHLLAGRHGRVDDHVERGKRPGHGEHTRRGHRHADLQRLRRARELCGQGRGGGGVQRGGGHREQPPRRARAHRAAGRDQRGRRGPEYAVRGGVTYRVLSDHLGSPRPLVDVATGTVAWRADFDAWGNRKPSK